MGPSGIYFLLFKSRTSSIQKKPHKLTNFCPPHCLKTLMAEASQSWSFTSTLSSANTQNSFFSLYSSTCCFFLCQKNRALPSRTAFCKLEFTSLISPLFLLITHNSSRFSRFLRVLAAIWLWQLLDHWLFIHCISKGCGFLWIELQYSAQIPLSFQPVYFMLLLTGENPPDVEATSSDSSISSFLNF